MFATDSTGEDTKSAVYQTRGLSVFYSVDYRDLTECRWVRNPFCSWDEVQMIIEALPYGYDEESEQQIPLFENFRIMPESELSQLRCTYDLEKQEVVTSDVTNRMYHFDDRYEMIAESITGEQSLTRIHKETFWTKGSAETREEWEARVRRAEEQEPAGLRGPSGETIYEELQQRLVLEFRAENPPNRFLMGNLTFRPEMPGADEVKKQLAQMSIDKALKDDDSDTSGKGFG